eukprot:gene8491-4852_t
MKACFEKEEASDARDRTSFCPNDTYISDYSSLHLITGPNMSGKSTYLKQVALMVVMAQAGCHVPATHMFLSPFKSLFTRMGTGDRIDTNSSSFMVEMQEVAHILERSTSRSLVLIDELGRATSTSDGVAIAWAVCEKLLSVGAFTLFATHFRQLSELGSLYPAACQWQGEHYGLALARSVGFPEHILSVAARVASNIDTDNKVRLAANSMAHSNAWTAVHHTAGKLSELARRFDAALKAELIQTQPDLSSFNADRSQGTQADSMANGEPADPQVGRGEPADPQQANGEPADSQAVLRRVSQPYIAHVQQLQGECERQGLDLALIKVLKAEVAQKSSN